MESFTAQPRTMSDSREGNTGEDVTELMTVGYEEARDALTHTGAEARQLITSLQLEELKKSQTSGTSAN